MQEGVVIALKCIDTIICGIENRVVFNSIKACLIEIDPSIALVEDKVVFDKIICSLIEMDSL